MRIELDRAHIEKIIARQRISPKIRKDGPTIENQHRKKEDQLYFLKLEIIGRLMVTHEELRLKIVLRRQKETSFTGTPSRYNTNKTINKVSRYLKFQILF